MPDPIDELENFSIPGPPMNPLPAADVRRRGDKIRRRNNALATVGGLAAVAVIAAPFAIFAGGHDSSTPQPTAPSPTEWHTTIPGSFDLTAVPEGAPITFDAQAEPAIDDVQLCGEMAFSTTDAADGAGASYQGEGSEDSAGRTLVVYDDSRQAATALATFRQGVASCPVDRSTGGARLEYDLVGNAPASTEDGFVYSEQVRQGDLYYDLTMVEVAQVGNAIFVGNTHGSVGGDQQVEAETSRLGDLSEPVITQMCVFSAAGCGDDDQAVDPSIGEGAVPAIPGDFPLAAGLPDGGLDGRVPSPEPTACGNTVAAPDSAVETQRAQWRSISEIRDRQLMTFAREADAQTYAEAVADVYCGTEDLGGGATRATFNFGGAPLGDFSAIAVRHNEMDGQVDAGLVLTQVVRVGRAVLVGQRVDEGFTWSGDVEAESQQLAEASSTELGPVVDAMCTFTETGC